MKCSYAQVNYWDFLRRMQKSIPVHADVTKLVHAAGILSKLPILCDDTGGLDIQQLRLRARRWRDKKQVEIIVVDYLQLLHDRENSRQGRQVEVSKISASLKECAKELNIPILALAQLSRQPEQKGRGGIPKLSDLRDSGSIEQDADNVWLMRRPCKCEDDPQAEDKTLAIIDVAKQRNGPTGPVHLNFQPEFTRFEDRATGVDGQEDFEEFDAL
jgi:replicative DNA helicase